MPGADKGIAWRSSSDSHWVVCLSNSLIDIGVSVTVTPLFNVVGQGPKGSI